MANKKYKLTDGNYWATDGVYDFDQGKTQREVNGDLIGATTNVQNQITANVQTSTTASKAYAVGEFLVLNGTLYRVTSAISNGGTITPNTNVVATSVEKEVGYYPGTTLTMPNAYMGQYAGRWDATSGNKMVRFLIPLPKAIIANTVTLTGTVFLYTNGNRITVDLSTAQDISMRVLKTLQGVGVEIIFTDGTTGENIYTPCTAQISNGTISFS